MRPAMEGRERVGRCWCSVGPRSCLGPVFWTGLVDSHRAGRAGGAVAAADHAADAKAKHARRPLGAGAGGRGRGGVWPGRVEAGGAGTALAGGSAADSRAGGQAASQAHRPAAEHSTKRPRPCTTSLAPTPKTQPVQVEVQSADVAQGLLGVSGQIVGSAIIVFVLGYFILAFSDCLLRQALSGVSSFKQKRGGLVEIVLGVESGVSRYLLTITVINTGLGSPRPWSCGA